MAGVRANTSGARTQVSASQFALWELRQKNHDCAVPLNKVQTQAGPLPKVSPTGKWSECFGSILLVAFCPDLLLELGTSQNLYKRY